MPETSTIINDDTLVKHREAATIELTPLRTTRTSSEAKIGLATSARSPASVGTQAIADSVVAEDFPTGIRLYVIFLALALSVLIVGLDGSIVATTIPQLTDSFRSLGDVGWYGSAYLLTACTCQLAYGSIYQLFSLKWVYLCAIVLFEIGSVISAAAQTSSVFIAGRAISGIGFAGINCGSLIIVAHAIPLDRRPMFTAVIGVMEGLGIILGPLVGGALTAHATWRWCFWINLPVGAMTALVIAFLLHPPTLQDGPPQTLKEKFRHFDWLGTAVIIPSLVCLLLALQWGGSKYRWEDARIISLFVLFAVLLLVFIIKEKISTSIVTIPRLVASSRSMIFSILFAFCLSSAISILSFYLPLWFQAIKGASAFNSGVMLLPVILGLLAGTVMAGVLVTVLGYYQPFMVLSGILAATGAGLLTTFTAETSSSVWIGYLSLVGIGAGLGFQQPFLAVQTVLEKNDIPIGTSLIILSQTLAGAIFVSVGGTIFSNELVDALKVQVPRLNPMVVLESGATNVRQYVPQEYLDGVLRAFNSAIVRTFYAAVATSGLAAFVAMAVEVRCIESTKSKGDTEVSRECLQGSPPVHADN